ncbi:DUF6270 domain-containing protein [Cellulosimicrobium cellulans]|uniref:DUF6270 domain-containing protein n=1 Tax=Cellulosimicrobium cellulans TaxID=1710 RepID=UPI0035D74CA7
MSDRPSVFIYGSCVSRDMCRLFPTLFGVERYIARQSWVSTFSAPTSLPSVASKLASAFQSRMVESDFASQARIEIASVAHRANAVLLDIVDERYGVVPTSTGFVTNSYEFLSSGWKALVSTGDAIPFGSDAHFELWFSSAERMADLLHSVGMFERTNVVRAPYATHTDEGVYLGDRRGRPVEEWNSVYARYYEALASLGFCLIDVPSDLVVTRADHAWGAEPFHYIDDFYLCVANMLERRLRDIGAY